METKIEIKVGDKVIRSDGLAGNVVDICQCEQCELRGFFEPRVKYEDGYVGDISIFDAKNNFADYYLIGTTVLGNKRPIEELDDRIADTHMGIERLKAEEKQLRKQRWRLQYQMNGDFVPQNPKKED